MSSMAEMEDLLVRTSRTFALSIPLLPQPTRDEVTTSYLLFRIADTFEDGADWSGERRIRALRDFAVLLQDEEPPGAEALAREWTEQPPIRHDGYVDLLKETPLVLRRYRALRPEARRIIRSHVVRTAEGMAGFVERSRPTGVLSLNDLPELRNYCYYVAGIVGEMLTELFLIDRPALLPVAAVLRERSSDFGEGLQLTNIVKDCADDVTEGRGYLPPGVPREEVFALARDDLRKAAEYVAALEEVRAPRGLIAFNALPVLLAQATLDRVEAKGPGAKLTRPEVFFLVRRMNRALDRGRPVLPAPVSG